MNLLARGFWSFRRHVLVRRSNLAFLALPSLTFESRLPFGVSDNL
jgi:hypothetical protein